MSRKRDKKSPMFVSNINTNYEFADFTESPEKYSPSTFGNPNLQPFIPQSPQQSPANISREPISPKKPESNWFQQMLQAHKNNNIASPTSGKAEVIEIDRKNFQKEAYKQTNSPSINQLNPASQPQFQPPTQGFSPHQPSQNFQPAFKKQLHQQNSHLASQNLSRLNPTHQLNMNRQNSLPAFQKVEFGHLHHANNFASSHQQQPEQNAHNVLSEKRGYQFKGTTFQQSNQQITSLNPFNEITQSPKTQNKFQAQSKFSIGAHSSLNEKPGPERALQKASSYSSFSRSTSSGFTDESIVDCLPQPARSNILAMIRRNKGLSSY